MCGSQLLDAEERTITQETDSKKKIQASAVLIRKHP